MSPINGRQLLELALAHEDVDHTDPASWGPILRYVADEGLTLDHFDVLAARAVPLAVFAVALVAGLISFFSPCVLPLTLIAARLCGAARRRERLAD